MSKQNSPFKIAPMIIGAGLSLLGGAFGAIGANKAKREAERKEAESRKEMNRLKNIYSNLDTSNPFLNMENVMEDLTINQKQAEFEKEQFQQSQSNILGSLKGAAGSSGVAALAQSLAQQGQLAAQKSSASIGQQESQNQKLERQMAGQIQEKEIQGEMYSRNLERDKYSTLLGMSQQETAAYGQQAQAADTAKWDAISGTVSNLSSFIPTGGGAKAGGLPEGVSQEDLLANWEKTKNK